MSVFCIPEMYSQFLFPSFSISSSPFLFLSISFSLPHPLSQDYGYGGFGDTPTKAYAMDNGDGVSCVILCYVRLSVLIIPLFIYLSSSLSLCLSAFFNHSIRIVHLCLHLKHLSLPPSLSSVFLNPSRDVDLNNPVYLCDCLYCSGWSDGDG